MIHTPNILVRFAPSPTGKLHVGNTRTALVNYLFAKANGGRFMLRIDDTDQERSRDEYEEAIKADLQWLGMAWCKLEKQSDRFARYEEAKQKLVEMGRLYPCYETPDELEVKRKMLVSRGKPPIYDRGALKLTANEEAAFKAEGRQPHWRFKLDHAEIAWDDLVRGRVSFNGANLSDPVLIRKDGVPLFTLSTSVDDGEHGITHILRGEDHVSNTAIQVQIMETLGYTPPVMGHTALLQMKGAKISKREGGGDVEGLRESGIMPMAVNSYLAKIGTSDAIAPFETMNALIESFDITKFGRNMASFDPEELTRINEKLIHELSFADAQPHLKALGLDQADAEFWDDVKRNLTAFADAQDWWELLREPLAPVIADEDKDYTAQAAKLLSEGDGARISEDDWGALIYDLKDKTDRKGKQLFMPLRLALTARTDGPELPKVVELLGRDRVLKRLNGETA